MLNDLGLSYLWLQRVYTPYSIDCFKNLVKQRLHDQFLQTWQQSVEENSVCISYKLFKENICFERYLIKLSPSACRNMCNFRLSNHRLPIHQLRQTGIPRGERVCPLCDLNEMGDEFHYLFKCSHPVLNVTRQNKLPRYYQHHANVIKMHQLLNSCSKKRLTDLACFMKTILSLF